MSKTEWKECTLGDLIRIKHGYAFKGDYITTNDNGVVLVTPGNFAIGGGFQERKCKFFSSDYPNDYVLKAGDLIVTMTDLSKDGDTLGYSAKVPSSENRVYLHNQRIGLIELKNKNVDPNFLYWVMRSPSYQKGIVATASGSTVKHTSPGRICESKILLPPLAEQQRIAKILSSLDDKIELNNAINRNLEEQAQAIFKSWFVDFEPFGGEMPENWEIGKIGDLVERTINGDWGKDEPIGTNTEEVFCIRGADIPEVKKGNKGKMPTRYILPKNYQQKKLEDGDLVVEISGGSPIQSTGRAAYISDALLERYNNKIVCTNFCKAIKFKKKIQYIHVFLLDLFVR